MDCPPVTNQEARAMILAMVGPERTKKFDENRDLDFSTQIASGHRFRVNAHVQRDTIALSFRVISNQIAKIDDLHLPSLVKELTDLPRGLVLVTGHTGSGKSTTWPRWSG
jgi:twitching motility protein PilT